MDQMRPPYSQSEVENMNGYQASDVFHPLTCGNDSGHPNLVATEAGWHCPACEYKQTWSYGFVCDGTWREAVVGRQRLRDGLDELTIVRKPRP